MIKPRLLATPLAVLVAASLCSACGNHGAQGSGASEDAMEHHARPDTSDRIAINQLKASVAAGPEVTSSAFQDGGPIPEQYSDYGGKVSPPLAWTATQGAKSWALIVEDPDAPKAEPFVHWVAWDIPGGTTSLPEGLPGDAHIAQPSGMRQGKNGSGAIGWYGPHPPQNDPPHHYHFQVFALDVPGLSLGEKTDRKALVKAMEGHVIADAELIGLYQAKARH